MAPAGGNAGGPGVSALRGFSLWRLCRLGSTDRHTHDIREKRRSLSIFAVRVGFRCACWKHTHAQYAVDIEQEGSDSRLQIDCFQPSPPQRRVFLPC
jgi:hypothetical protein